MPNYGSPTRPDRVGFFGVVSATRETGEASDKTDQQG